MMRAYSQYIIHKLKVPADYRTGTPGVDPHSPKVWTDFDTASAAAAHFGPEYGVGFVFTAADPFWFVDIDKCLITGYWAAHAVELCHLFAGCYVEVSQSGTGLHIVGTGAVPTHACRNSELGMEFYTEGRYMALGVQGQGDPLHDASELMPAFVEKYFPPVVADSAQWSEGHELGWELPDDDELIRRALAMTGGAGAVFSGRVTFAELWKGDAVALARAYPAEGRPYDASSADLALASKLAWLTGNDCPRIERLMQRSGLVRDKWEKHPSYLSGRTIPRSLVRDGQFYDPKYASRRAEQVAANVAIGEDSGIIPPAGVIELDEMVRRYAYALEGKRVVDVDNPKRIFSVDEFRSAYKASKTFYEVAGDFHHNGDPKRKSMETAKLWEDHAGRLMVDSVTFRPGFPINTVDPDGKHSINTWRPIERTSPTVGDPGIFLRHVVYLFQDDADRFLDWLAHIEQKPGVLPHTGWVHISPMQGTGRNWLSSVMVRLWRGYVAASFDLSGTLKNGYNGQLSQKLLAIVDEINEGGSSAKWENAEVLKSIVTPQLRQVNPKYGYQRLEYNTCRWLIFSNHTGALPLTEGDRRFNVVLNTLPPCPESYYRELYAALDHPGFIESVAWMLHNRAIEGFNPGAHAMLTEAKRDLVAASRTEADDIIAHLIQEHPSDVIANSELAAALTGQPFGAKLTPAHRRAMQGAGMVPYGKAIRLESGAVIKVNIVRNHSNWKNAEAHDIKIEMGRKR